MKQIAGFLLWWLLLWSLLVWCFATWAFGQVSPPLPERPAWEAQMVRFGKQHCQTLATKQDLGDVYYDAARVYYQIANYTGDPAWLPCAEQANQLYRTYVIGANGAKGTWIFPQGLWHHYRRSCPPDGEDGKALRILATKSAYSADNTPLAWTKPAPMSREVAYQIGNFVLARQLGINKEQRLTDLVGQALDHLRQWTVDNAQGTTQVRPFMVALTAEALIAYHAETPDPRILPALQTAAAYLWTQLWVAEAKAFQYSLFADKDGGVNPAPDLNLLIAPLYGWLYWQTKEVAWRDRGDLIFSGGVTKGYVQGTKQFMQSYRWSIDYVRWRNLR